MLCSKYKEGIVFHTKGEKLKPKHEMFLVPLRDKEKILNGHFLINFGVKGGAVVSAGQRISVSSWGEDDDNKGCGISYFLKNGKMDYLYDEAIGLKIYATTTVLAEIVKMGLRSFLDAVCILCTPAHFKKLLPFASLILEILKSFPKLSPILPTVEELMARSAENEELSRFTVATVSRFHHYYRGVKGTNYLTHATLVIPPWNQDDDTLPEESRLEWMTISASADEVEEPPNKKKKALQPSRNMLEARRWVKANYVIRPDSQITKRAVHQNYLDNCEQDSHMADSRFGMLLHEIYPDLISNEGSGVRRNGSRTFPFYANLSISK